MFHLPIILNLNWQLLLIQAVRHALTPHIVTSGRRVRHPPSNNHLIVEIIFVRDGSRHLLELRCRHSPQNVLHIFQVIFSVLWLLFVLVDLTVQKAQFALQSLNPLLLIRLQAFRLVLVLLMMFMFLRGCRNFWTHIFDKVLRQVVRCCVFGGRVETVVEDVRVIQPSQLVLLLRWRRLFFELDFGLLFVIYTSLSRCKFRHVFVLDDQ